VPRDLKLQSSLYHPFLGEPRPYVGMCVLAFPDMLGMWGFLVPRRSPYDRVALGKRGAIVGQLSSHLSFGLPLDQDLKILDPLTGLCRL
jgi:hypothetical protein